MTKMPFTKRGIHVYTCLTDPTRKCQAQIDGFPMIFRGDTPMQARKAADDWRKEAIENDKLLTKAQKDLLLQAGAK